MGSRLVRSCPQAITRTTEANKIKGFKYMVKKYKDILKSAMKKKYQLFETWRSSQQYKGLSSKS
jgi:hypothetical protein